MKSPTIDAVVSYVKTHTWKETSEHFKISEMTISRYLKKHAQIGYINSEEFTKLLKRGFNKLLKKPILEMSAVELKIILYLLSGKSLSLRKSQYIPKITKLAGVKQ